MAKLCASFTDSECILLLLYSSQILNALTTYLVILIQFDSAYEAGIAASNSAASGGCQDQAQPTNRSETYVPYLQFVLHQGK